VDVTHRIERVVVDALDFPVDDPPESDGTLAWSSTGIVLVRVACDGVVGLGWSPTHPSAKQLVESKLAEIVVGRRPYDVPAITHDLLRAVRNVGNVGLAATAISAIDVALWDLKARLLDVALVDLLGRAREAVTVYGSGGFTSYDDAKLAEQLGGWAREGFRHVKMKVGREPGRDPHRVAVAREAIGPEVELFVDANGAYTRKQALALAERFVELGVTWLEEPVSSDDHDGLRLIRDRVPAPIRVAAGEYGFGPDHFVGLLRAGAVDVLMPDATRCLGVTGFLQAAALAGAFHLPVSAHCAPSLHVQLGCAVPNVTSVEWFHDHARLEAMLFDGTPTLVDGRAAPPTHRPGHGLVLREDVARRFAA
jgi:L-alanine-DL-glutamate epimerase-like enolase superfamily enzyme